MKLEMVLSSKCFFGLSAFLFCACGSAYELKANAISHLFIESVEVYRVTVTSGSLNVISSDGRSVDCGKLYRANVASTLKGERGSIAFQSFSELKIGGDYLIFFSDENLDAYVNYISMGKGDKLSFNACSESDSLYASDFHGMIYEFDGLFSAEFGLEAVKTVGYSVDIPSSVKTYVVSASSDLAGEGYLESVSFKLIDWKDLEKYLEGIKKGDKFK